jgi:hypothetical protein
MPTKTTSVKPNTTTDLQNQIDSLTQELETERAKTRHFGTILGQMRYRVTEVLELDNKTRTKILTEIDTVFNRAL